MNSSIEIAIKTLGESMRAEVRAAQMRAENAERRLNGLAAGLRTLIAKLPDPANDHEAPIATPCSETKKRPPSVPDRIFLKALGNEWSTAGDLWKGLNSCGFKVGEGTVYNRMRKLAAEHPDKIDATDKPERWRRKLDTRTPTGANDFDAKVAGKRKRPPVKPRLRLVSTESSTVHNGKGGGQ